MNILETRTDYERLVLATVVQYLRPAMEAIISTTADIPEFKGVSVSGVSHKKVWDVIYKCYKEDKPFDHACVDSLLVEAFDNDDNAYPGVFISKSVDYSVPVDSLPYHVSNWVDVAYRDTIGTTCIGITTEAISGAKPEKLHKMLKDLIRPIGENRQKPTAIADIIPGVLADILHNDMLGLKTGLEKFDNLTAGLEPAKLYIFAGRPGTGKSALMLSITKHLAADGFSVGVLSLEMSEGELIGRMASTLIGISYHKFRQGGVSVETQDKLSDAVHKIGRLPIFIDDTPTMKLDKVLYMAKEWKATDDIDILFIDHIQLVQNPNGNSRNESLGEVSRSLKGLSKELNIPIVALSQLSREVEKSHRKPILSDLRDSGELEQDADLVAFLHSTDNESSELELIVRKQRSGPLGTATVYFDRETGRFGNLQQEV